MPLMEQQGNDAGGDEVEAARWPLYVRVLAVCYVLSYALQVVAFFGLVLSAAFLSGFGRRLNPWAIGLLVTGAAVVIFCWLFRRWFVWWGRRNYPTGKPE